MGARPLCAVVEIARSSFYAWLAAADGRAARQAADKALAARIGTVHCSSCGAPVDIRADDSCPHCSSPITILDPEAVEKALADYPIGVLKTVICQRVSFAESAADGRTVLETEPAGQAAGEVRGLVAEIVEMAELEA